MRPKHAKAIRRGIVEARRDIGGYMSSSHPLYTVMHALIDDVERFTGGARGRAYGRTARRKLTTPRGF
jgi:hypothetical protein